MSGLLNTSASLDARNVVSGKDAQIFIAGSDGVYIQLGEVEQFHAQMAVTNATIKPLGSVQEMAYPTGYKVTITFTEMVVRNNLTLKRIYDDLKDGIFPRWDIKGKVLRKSDGTYYEQIFSDCVPEGNVDLLNITAGEVIKRPWSFIVNGAPTLTEGKIF